MEGPCSRERRRVGVGSGETSLPRFFAFELDRPSMAASNASRPFEGLESNLLLLVGVSGISSSSSSTSINSNLTRFCVKMYLEGDVLGFIADFTGEAVVERVRRGEGGLFSLNVDIIFFDTESQFFDRDLRKASNVLRWRLYVSIRRAGST